MSFGLSGLPLSSFWFLGWWTLVRVGDDGSWPSAGSSSGVLSCLQMSSVCKAGFQRSSEDSFVFDPFLPREVRLGQRSLKCEKEHTSQRKICYRCRWNYSVSFETQAISVHCLRSLLSCDEKKCPSGSGSHISACSKRVLTQNWCRTFALSLKYCYQLHRAGVLLG